jgi:hypothetical protein
MKTNPKATARMNTPRTIQTMMLVLYLESNQARSETVLEAGNRVPYHLPEKAGKLPVAKLQTSS